MFLNVSGNAAAMFCLMYGIYFVFNPGILDVKDHGGPQSRTMEICIFDRSGRWKMGQFWKVI